MASKLTFTERKALLQLSHNSIFSPGVTKNKNAMALLHRLKERGLITFDDDENPLGAELTDDGLAAIGKGEGNDQ